jgi:hypothetical protein
MKAFEVFVIYVAPFLIIAAAIKLCMKRHAIDLSDVQETAGLSLSADFCSERGG